MDVSSLAHVIAATNAATAVCLVVGYIRIKHGERERHRQAMLWALAFSAAFLMAYVIYKANAGFAKFGGEGVVRSVYFTILTIHVIGAMALVPLVPILVTRALKGQFAEHRALARWTWPLWMFVAVSGVVVYVMAVHLYPYVPPAGVHPISPL